MWLKRGEYYEKREFAGDKNFEEAYWVEPVDPDGNVRDLLAERERKVASCRTELAFINALDPGRVLDAGCGLGHVLSGISADWDKYGLEVSQFAAGEAAKYGEIFCGELHEAHYDSEFFDVVLLYHVIEHVDSPENVVSEIHRILRADGSLIVGAPNFDSACARRYGADYRMLSDPTHVNLFTDFSLRDFLEDGGFSVDYIDYPYFETEHFTKDNLLRLLDSDCVSPPFYGNVMTAYATRR